ncbi:VOC family protein [Pseudomaricurvus alkylphenolicus]|jgi:catechol 2,3-dioxygenase-like lactoylglutathione lyase family enzyme|uniref:VOC family protein n=1 Tax=Pseudomaricurvus alkylphenolicus TaxID=1306991 RepID=UPI00141F8FF8|nr:VOC family protein [Pseudomaricurvus alkylphenolicus]NIB41895.1 VOC family protein [Pseudomaricurvus alkylphenolicus]
MIPRLTHLALHVEDVEACIDFYRDFCQMRVCHRRESGSQTIVWMSEPGQEQSFVFVMMDKGHRLELPERDYRHFGFAVESREQVDLLAQKAEREGCLLWPPREEAFPVGYYCGVMDPAGNQVEFSYGQPLGPGAPSLE